tara:strand:- start:258 stop:500 length:243 start_codon:yes stop_codon:yes gene_type:complete
MKLEEIIKTTKLFLAEEFEINPAEITAENNLHKTLDLDSLDYVDLVVIIEENFGLKLTAEDFANIQTFGDFFNFVLSKKA